MQRLCIFSKKVHASERRWSRLVIPGAQVPHFEAMQRELRTSGDFQLWVLRSGSGSGSGGAQAWRWGCRMSVQVKWCCGGVGTGPLQGRLQGFSLPCCSGQPLPSSPVGPACLALTCLPAHLPTHLLPQRPMILELSQFYDDNAVTPGDTVSLYRDLRTSALTVEVEHAAAAEQADAAAAAAVAAAPTARVAALPMAVPAGRGAGASGGAAAAAAVPGGHLPAARWHFKASPRPQQGRGGGSVEQCSPAHSEGEDEDGDMEYSPTAASDGRGGATGGRGGASRGALAVRRRLQQLQGFARDSDCSDEVGGQLLLGRQTRQSVHLPAGSLPNRPLGRGGACSCHSSIYMAHSNCHGAGQQRHLHSLPGPPLPCTG